MRHTKYSNEEIIVAVQENFSIAGVLRKIGLAPVGGNYKTITQKIKKLGLDMAHFTGKGHLKNKTHTWANKAKLEDVFSGKITTMSTSHFKKRLFMEGIKSEVCEMCGIATWLGNKLSLELHHENGNTFDNSLENLKILCPNCHSQTKTYRGRKKKEKSPKQLLKIATIKIKPVSQCSFCKTEIGSKGKTGLCLNCSQRNRFGNLNRPSIFDLEQDIKILGYCGTGRKYGVSGNAIKKWIKK